MPIMDGLAATKRIRELEQLDKEISHNTPVQDQPSSDGMDIATRRSQRIPIVGLSADIQHSTKEVIHHRLVLKKHERRADFFFYRLETEMHQSRNG